MAVQRLLQQTRDLSVRRRFILGAFAGQLAFTGIAFVGSVAIARMLGASGRGEYTLWTLIAFGLAMVATGSIPAGAGRHLLRGRAAGSLVRPLVQHAGVTLLMSAPIALLLVLTGTASPWTLAAIMVILVPATVLVEDLLVVARAEKNGLQFQGLRVLNATTTTVIASVVLLAFGGTSPAGAFAMFAVGTTLAAAVGFVALNRRRHNHDSRPPRLVELRRLGSGSFSATAFDRLLMRLDQVLVYAFLGPAALGVYGVARNWAEVAQAAAHSIGHGVFEAGDTLSPGAALRLFVRGAAAVGALGLAASIAGWALIPWLFGPEFEDARWYVLMFLPAVVVRTIGFSGQEVLIAQGFGRASSIATGTALCTGVVTWSVGAVTLGVPGVAAATSVAYGAQAALVWWALRNVVVSSDKHLPASDDK